MWDNGGECMLSACDKNSLFILACCKGVCFALYALAVVISAFGFACIYSWVCVHLFLGLRAFVLGFACIYSWVCVSNIVECDKMHMFEWGAHLHG